MAFLTQSFSQTLTQLFSPCLLGHADDPLRTRHDGRLHWECRRCGQRLAPVLPRTTQTKTRRHRRPRVAAETTERDQLSTGAVR